jgi:hypothetical protein
MKKFFNVLSVITIIVIYVDMTDIEGKIPKGTGLVIIYVLIGIIFMYPLMKWISTLRKK